MSKAYPSAAGAGRSTVMKRTGLHMPEPEQRGIIKGL